MLCDDEVMGKPKSPEEAKVMLQKLSGRTHIVASGIAITTKTNGIQSMVDTCEVTFMELNADLMDHYIQRYEPFDQSRRVRSTGFTRICRRENVERILFHRHGFANALPFQSFKQFEIITLESWL